MFGGYGNIPRGSDGKENLDSLVGQGDEYELRECSEPTYNLEDAKECDMVNWRAKCFLGAGLDIASATALAIRKDIDRVRVETMTAQGATGAQVCGALL